MKALLFGIATFVLTTNAFGSLILQSTTPTIDVSGTGLGAVNTVLTIQSPASSSTESGCVAFSGGTSVTTGCGFTNSTVLTGASQIGTPTLAAIGVTSAANLGIVLNAAEPGGTANSLGIDQVQLQLFSATGTSIFTANCSNCGIIAPSTLSGTGSSGFLFKLDATQAAAANTAIAANGGASSVRVGLGASLSLATGGNETFFASNVAGAAVPEPSPILLLGAGLMLLGAFRRKISHS